MILFFKATNSMLIIKKTKKTPKRQFWSKNAMKKNLNASHFLWRNLIGMPSFCSIFWRINLELKHHFKTSNFIHQIIFEKLTSSKSMGNISYFFKKKFYYRFYYRKIKCFRLFKMYFFIQLLRLVSICIKIIQILSFDKKNPKGLLIAV